eukprot:TRINITY_DN2134_c0_g1_i12.p1 TRINITY_DN2134_c0_g1~~TRINITY_DN2134_c0_g1_i12.p1  ORF type:complete len:184 (+),score=45.08 TRINITY_DN2134_c0_g1_i12:933-1484(+)
MNTSGSHTIHLLLQFTIIPVTSHLVQGTASSNNNKRKLQGGDDSDQPQQKRMHSLPLTAERALSAMPSPSASSPIRSLSSSDEFAAVKLDDDGLEQVPIFEEGNHPFKLKDYKVMGAGTFGTVIKLNIPKHLFGIASAVVKTMDIPDLHTNPTSYRRVRHFLFFIARTLLVADLSRSKCFEEA